jgi:polysaccharide export outer membrane protein
MRECSASKMLAFTGLILTLLFSAGCRSTSLSPLAREAAADSKNSFAWKKTNAPPSAALATDSWNHAGKPPAGIQSMTFQEPTGKGDEQPIPEIFVKNADDPLPRRPVAVQPVSFRHGAKAQANMPVMIALPNAPTEGNPTLLPEYMIRPPDVLLIDSQKGLLTQPVRGQHLVRPDGTVGLGIYGPASVAGRTIMQAREEIARVINSKMAKEPSTTDKGEKITPPTPKDVLDGLSVDVLAYNSSVYYIITDGAGLGQQVYRFPATGNETVLDAIANINGLPVVSSQKRIWVARRNPGMPSPDNILPVDWKGITQEGAMNTNWQVMPGDRIFVQADPMRRFNNNLSKMLEPIERLMGVTLLSGQAVNVIRSGNNNVNNTTTNR